MRPVLLSLLLASSVVADTKVAVLEFGASGLVRKTGAATDRASANGVRAFWSSLHSGSRTRRLSTQGMPLVSDIFSKPDAGLAVGVVGEGAADLAALEELLGASVGAMTVGGSHGRSLLETANAASGMEAIEIDMSATTAEDANARLARVLAEVSSKAQSEGKKYVLHLLVDDETSRRKLAERELAGDDAAAANDAYYVAAADDGSSSSNSNQKTDGFYGYGYFNDNNEWVAVSRTIFQIQYYQTLLWTAIGLAGILYSALYMTAYMPLMADTLLFGESAKVVGE